MEAQETPETSAPDKTKPAGWWSLNLRGSRDGVLRRIASAPEVPSFWKAALAAEIAACDSQYNWFILDAHYVTHGGKRVLSHHLDASRADL